MVLEVLEDFDELPYYFNYKCDYCGKDFLISKQQIKNNKTHCCSRECSKKLKKAKPNCKCAVCGKRIHRKQSYINKTKHITCSYECCYKLKELTMLGENNHQYGLRGDENSSYVTGEYISTWGYKKIYSPGHPESRHNYTFEHRLIAETYLLDNTNSYEYKGGKFLAKDYIVHHLDFNRLNNDPNNLAVMYKGDHSKFHNTLKIIVRDKNGKITNIQDNSKQLSGQQLRNKFFEFVNKNNIYYNALPTSKIDKKLIELALIPYKDYDIIVEETERGAGGIGSTGK